MWLFDPRSPCIATLRMAMLYSLFRSFIPEKKVASEKA
jgi:hypothetical protein